MGKRAGSRRNKDGTRILKQQRPASRKGNITMAQARRAVRLYFERLAKA